MIGSRRSTSPTVAGTVMNSASRREKLSVAMTPAVSPTAAWRAMAGSEAEASAMPKTPSGNSMMRSA